MASSTKTQTDSDGKARIWLKPHQVESMRNATVEHSADYLAARNDALIGLLYDTGLRVNEAVSLDTEMIDFDEGIIGLPPNIQKSYPSSSDRTPEYTRIGLADSTARTLRMYLSNRWKDTDAVFPSRQSDRMTTESVRNVVQAAALDADIDPQSIGTGGKPEDVTPHTLRHSVAYRMMAVEDGNTLWDVRNRLRHQSIQTTERVYDHFDTV